MIPRIHSFAPLTLFLQLGLFLAAVPANAGVVFSESFESPVVSGYANNTVPSNGKWIGAALGYNSGSRGL